ncbi:MAG: hypothetical protein NZ901_07930 [Geminocystis sp.]|nr:hypothetical protein [Geminocystis sp.]HIK37972.1 hypothetical protein [Geminocystis sp. M7585_C2015_104]MCS7148101.1 hypothetical protein [Geminocystis sp.]MCX8077846.1 hypothetical protein [Geminocystis sp.]MDW8116453.1 hypothetical protein [Geminocystis sp.]
MEHHTIDWNQAGVTPNDYCVFGLATCFLKQDDQLQEVKIIEPIPSAFLETLFKGIPTSYQLAVATTVGEVIRENGYQKPSSFPPDSQFGQDFLQRTLAATRTYKANPDAKKLIPLGETKTDFNYSLERKRVLNSINIVSDKDNIKQHPYTHKRL